ncbi:LLM class flavin-dependent oxidoreductase (plasmid) [Coraliomargarita sp. W4R53]
MANGLGSFSIGIAAAAGADVAARIAPEMEAAGFRSLWVNDTPGHDALEVLAAAAKVTTRLRLATGVIPIDRRLPHEIVARMSTLDLPADRLVLGIGSGALRKGALDAVETAASTLTQLSGARVMIGALGPRMRALAASSADGPLLSWLTPDAAAEQAAQARRSGAAHVALYVRAALDEESVDAMRAEAERYASFASYAANFERLGIDVHDTCITADDAPSRITAYRSAVDEVVLRAITAGGSQAEYLDFVRRTAALAKEATK